MDMKLHWLRCRIAQKQFRHYWKPGPTNLGDYITKHHASIHHRAVRGTYLTPKSKLDLLRRRALSATTAQSWRMRNMHHQQGCIRLASKH